MLGFLGSLRPLINVPRKNGVNNSSFPAYSSYVLKANMVRCTRLILLFFTNHKNSNLGALYRLCLFLLLLLIELFENKIIDCFSTRTKVKTVGKYIKRNSTKQTGLWFHTYPSHTSRLIGARTTERA